MKDSYLDFPGILRRGEPDIYTLWRCCQKSRRARVLKAERNSGGHCETVAIGVMRRSIVVNLDNSEFEIKPADDRHGPIGGCAYQIVVLPLGDRRQIFGTPSQL